MNTSKQVPGLEPPPNGFTHKPVAFSDIKQAQVPLALREFRNAEFVLYNKKREVPSLAEMANAVKEDPLTRMQKKLAALKKTHEEDLQKLYAFQQKQRRDEIEDQRKYLQDSIGYLDDEVVDNIDIWDTKVWESLFGAHPTYRMAREHGAQYEQLWHAYMVQVNAVLKAKTRLEERILIDKKAKERAFPHSIDDFKTKPKDLQILIAKFLDAKRDDRERMVRKHHWNEDEALRLIRIWETNPTWQNELRVLVISAVGLTDPRIRKQMAQ